jgi:metal-responsive CopG/Arc/MetJ family transcriptional regulator
MGSHVGAALMAVKKRISVSFNDQEFLILERLSAHTHKSKAELIRTIVEEFLRDNPNRFRRKTSVNRRKNLIMPDEPK